MSTPRRLEIRVIPRAKRNAVEADGQGAITVRVTAPPEDGRANDAVREALADHFRVKRSQVRIIKGVTARRKVVEIG